MNLLPFLEKRNYHGNILLVLKSMKMVENFEKNISDIMCVNIMSISYHPKFNHLLTLLHLRCL